MATATKVVAPAGVRIDVSRVNEELDSLTDARVGETIDFAYSRGSEGYGIRRVLVCSVNENGISGLDETRDGNWRHFLNEFADNIDVVEPFAEDSQAQPASPSNEVRVRFDVAGESLMQSITGERLAELYLQYVATEGESARFDSDSGEVVVTLAEAKIGVNYRGESSQTIYTNKAKETLVHYVWPSMSDMGVNIKNAQGNTMLDKVRLNPVEFAQILTAFLSR